MSQLAHSPAQRIRIHPQCLEPAAQLEEAGDFVLQRERLLEHAAQLVDLGAQVFCILGVLRELGLGAALRLRDVLGLLVERRQNRHQALERLDARLELCNDFLRVSDRLHELRETLTGLAGGGGQRFECHALALHLGKNCTQLSGKLLGGRFATENIPGGHEGSRRRGVRGGWARSRPGTT